MYYCANEVVFPLMTFPLLLLAFRAALVIVFRIPLWVWLKKDKLVADAQLALTLFPLQGILHVVIGGLLYYSYHYITMLLCAIQATLDWSRYEHFQPWARKNDLYNAALFYCLMALSLVGAGRGMNTFPQSLLTHPPPPLAPFKEALRLFYGANDAVHWVWVVLGPAAMPLFYVATEKATRPSRYTSSG
jgi:hypothetical protein